MVYGDARALRDTDLRRWRSQYRDATPLGSLPPRRVATCVGVIHTIRFLPGHGLEVVIEDGTGELTVIWSGRSSLPGLDLGAALRVTGTVADGASGPVMRNPDWALVTEPYS